MIKLAKRTFRICRDTVTVRPLRKYIGRKITQHKLEQIVARIEALYDGRPVLIFQHQMFDTLGQQCYNGGAERYVVDLADILFNRGYTPVLIQMGNPDGDIWWRDVGHLRIFGVPGKNYLWTIPLFKKYEFVIYSGATDWGRMLHPNILISHGVTWDTPDQNCVPRIILDRIRDADTLVSVDTNTISWLRTTFAKYAQRINMQYVPNYVDTTRYCPAPRRPDNTIQITFPRRASPERGYWLMSRALPPIMQKYKNAMFNFIGFAHGEKITNDIRRLMAMFPARIQHRVVEPDDMPTIYQNTDISLVPTLYAEGTSLSCLEAQSTGNVVIATNIGGLPNLVINGYNGILINPTGDDLIAALDTVLADAKLRKKLSENAISVAGAFDKSVWIQRWGKIIDSMKQDNV